jgi:hypothetical protein
LAEFEPQNWIVRAVDNENRHILTVSLVRKKPGYVPISRLKPEQMRKGQKLAGCDQEQLGSLGRASGV